MLTNWLTTTSDKEGEDFNNILNFQLHDFGCRELKILKLLCWAALPIC